MNRTSQPSFAAGSALYKNSIMSSFTPGSIACSSMLICSSICFDGAQAQSLVPNFFASSSSFSNGGAPHPIIDFDLRCQRILKEARNWEVAILLFDVVLGQGAHPDPAYELAKAVEEAKSIIDREEGYLSVMMSVVGTF